MGAQPMTRLNALVLVGALCVLAGLFSPWVTISTENSLTPIASSVGLEQIENASWAQFLLVAMLFFVLSGTLLRPLVMALLVILLSLGGACIALIVLKYARAQGLTGLAQYGFWLVLVGELLITMGVVGRLATMPSSDRVTQALQKYIPPMVVPPIIFLIWESVIDGLRVPMAFFPSISDILSVLLTSSAVLWKDSLHTFFQQMFFGYVLGALVGLGLAMMIALSPFLRRGFLPLATAFSSIPVVGLAPVLGRAFGIDWESKAVVAAIVTFFPIVINVVQGLTAVQSLQMDLMQSYAANRWEIFRKLRFPHALPYFFSALKITSIVSLISVIVAEFLIPGPPQGLGQRISLSARSGRYDITFAAIAFASVFGILFYSLMALLERVFAPWHSSSRTKKK